MEQRLSFPLKGLSEQLAEGDQAPLTTRSCFNVRDYDPLTGRLRGGQRAGLTAFSGGPTHRNYLSQTEDWSVSPWTPVTSNLVTTSLGNGEWAIQGENDGTVASIYQDIPDTVADWQVQRTLTFSLEIQRGTAFSTRILATRLIGTTGQGLSEDNVVRIGWNAAGGPSFTFTQGTAGATYTQTALADSWYRITITFTNNPVANFGGVRYELQPENTVGTPGDVNVRKPMVEIAEAFTEYSAVPVTLDHTSARTLQHGTGFVFKDKTLTYAEQTPVEEWSYQTPSKEDCKAIQVDSFGNVYALDGDSTIVKVNGSGKLVWSIPVPLQEDEGKLGVLFVDEFRQVYAAQNEGDQTLAQIFKYSQKPFDENVDDPESRTNLDWTIDLEGRVREMERREELLFVLVDNDTTLESAVVAYGGLETTEPYVAWIRQVAYPSNGLSIATDGAFFTTHEPNSSRGIHGLSPSSATTDTILESWTPLDLDATEYGTVYAWFDPADLLSTHSDGDTVTEWFDKHGRGPALFAPKDASGLFDETLAPIFVRYGSGGRPCVRFTGGRYMISGPNGTSQSSGASLAGTTLLPVYENAAFIVVMNVRPLDLTREGTILAHRSDSRDYAYTHNKRVDGTFNGETFAVWTTTDAAEGGGSSTSSGGGFGNYPRDDVSGFAFHANAETVTVFNGGGTTNTGHESRMRTGGRTIDVWEEGTVMDATEAVYLGSDEPLTTKHGSGEFEVNQIIVFQKQDPTDTASTIIESPELFDPDDGTPNVTQQDTSLEKVEGWMSWRHGCHTTLDTTTNPTTGPRHPYNTNLGCPVSPGKVDPNPLLEQGSLLTKYGPQGSLRWILSNYNGMGYDCVSDDGAIFCTGPSNDSANTNGVPVSVRRVIDKTTSGSVLLSEGAWAYNGLLPSDPDTRRAKADVDSAGNFYWPMDDNTFRDFTVRVFAKESDASSQPVVIHDYDSSTDSLEVRNCRQVVATKAAFDYEGDSARVPEFFWVGLEAQAPGGGAAESNQVAQVDQVSATPNGNEARGLQVITVTSGYVAEEIDSEAVLAGARLDPAAEYVDSAFIKNELALVDGDGYYVYNPRVSTLSQLEVENAGSIPVGFKLACNYRGRLFLANARDNGSAWAASKRGNIRNWDFIPAVPTVDQATSSTVARAGEPPDVVNALIPYSDDILIIGGDHSIWMLRGDPEQAGDWDQVSDQTGIAFGRAWCKDPSGALYFFGSRGIVYRMIPGGVPVPISDTAVDKRLRSIDLSLHRIEMAWNTDDRGFHLAVIRRVPDESIVESYFWSERTDSWWPDTFEGLRQPLSIFVIDGDKPDDRKVLQIGEDRWVRGWDQSATTDDGENIQSSVLIGPTMPPSQQTYRYRGLQATLADQQGGGRASWYLSDRPDDTGNPVWIQDLSGGRNPRSHRKFRGSYMWLQIDSGDSDRWAFESAFAQVHGAGRGRATR